MGAPLSPAKAVLLAVHFATHADIDSLAFLAAQQTSTLHKELLLRIILTQLPETVPPSKYTHLLKQIEEAGFEEPAAHNIDTSPVSSISNEEASRKAKKLHLLRLTRGDLPQGSDDPFTRFLFERAFQMDEQAGLLSQVPDLVLPFVHNPTIRTWTISTVVPLWRRTQEYYISDDSIPYSLTQFRNLPDKVAIDYLLAQTAASERQHGLVSRDLRGLVAPWLQDDERWTSHNSDPANSALRCPGWEQALEWLITQASKNWQLAVDAVVGWDGPSKDADLGAGVQSWFGEEQQMYLQKTYVRGALGASYLISEPTLEALDGAYQIVAKSRALLGLGLEADKTLSNISQDLPNSANIDIATLEGAKAASFMRNGLLAPSNPLTEPNATTTGLLISLILSAYLLTRLGAPCTIRQIGDLHFLRDTRDQKGEFSKLIRVISTQAPRNADNYWIQARREVMWLHNWGGDDEEFGRGPLGAISKKHIETEFLKISLASSRYDLARSVYENGASNPLEPEIIQDTVLKAALNAFDNASNPNRTRGGLKKCDEIIHTFPRIVPKSLLAVKQTESLLKATHALSYYRLVLNQGEPFNPVVLRVHSDPLMIIEKVLEQNTNAYTRLNEFLEMGVNMANAGLPVRKLGARLATAEARDVDLDIAIVEKRIVAICIESALREDDFETAYSYVVSRLGSSQTPTSPARTDTTDSIQDNWSWSAALKAGQYVRTERSQQPNHLGTASGNPEIRHLEQRIDCLATALRVAPPSQLQEILKTFRRCEEQLDSAVKEEAEKEAIWDAAGDMSAIPGAFDTPDSTKAYPPRNVTASATARQAEEAPMSLFDLSRATASLAQRNFTSLANLQGAAQGISRTGETTAAGEAAQPKVRKRDQLRDAATGTLVSGVGWLIGANTNTK